MDVDDTSPATVLAEANEEDADSLVSTNEPDDMAGEQTWPTEEEMSHSVNQEDNNDKSLPDASAGTTPKSIQKGKGKKVQRKSHGLGDYMASWIVESDEEDEDGDEDGEARPAEDDIDMNGVENSEEPVQNGDDDDDMDEEMSLDASAAKSSGRRVAFEDLDEEEEAEQ